MSDPERLRQALHAVHQQLQATQTALLTLAIEIDPHLPATKGPSAPPGVHDGPIPAGSLPQAPKPPEPGSI
jgi:hypothetical protein